MKPKNHRKNLLLLGSISITLASQSAHATDYTWDGGADASPGTETNKAWNTPTNWVGDTVPTFTDQANIIFYTGINQISGVGASAIITDRTIGSLTFNASATPMKLWLSSNASDGGTGAVLTLGGALVAPTITVNAASANHTIGGALGSVTLANNLTATINGSKTLTIARPIGGTGFGITKLETGALTLFGDNTFTGDFTLGNGTPNSTTNNTASAGSGGFVYAGHNNALGGGKVVSKGAQLRASTTGIVLSNAVDVDAGGFRLGGANDFELSGAVTIVGSSRSFTVAGSPTVTISGNIGDDGFNRGLTKDGSGTLVLSGTNNYTGATVANAGILVFTNKAAKATAVTANASGTVGLGVRASDAAYYSATDVGDLFNTNSLGGFSLNAASGVAIDTSNAGVAFDQDVALTAARSLTKLGTGTLILSTTNTHTGATTIRQGTLSVGTSANLGDAASNLVFDGGTLQITGTTLGNFSAIGHTVQFTAGKTVGLDIDNAAHTFTVDQVLDQTTGSFTKSGAGTAILNQINTYSGGTTLANGTLLLSEASSLGSGAVTVTGDTTVAGTVNGVVIGNNIAINPGVTLTAQTAASINLNLAGNLTGSGTLQGSSGIDVFRLFINGDNSAFTGTVKSRTTNPGLGVRFGNAGASLPGGTLVISSSVAVELNNADTYSFGTVTDTVGGGFTTTGGGLHTLSIGSNNNASSIAGEIKNGTGTIALTKTGSGTLTLTGTNTYTGTTRVSGGSLKLGASNVIHDSSPVIQTAGILEIADGVVETLHSIQATGGSINFGSGATGFGDLTLLNNSEVGSLTVGVTGILRLADGVTLTQIGNSSGLGDNESLTFDVGSAGLADISGDINTAKGNGAINKTGAGTLRLSSDLSQFGGGTIIENGTLEFTSLVDAGTNETSSLGDADFADVLQIGTVTNSATLRMIGTNAKNSSDRTVQLADAGSTIDIDDAAQTLTLSGVISKEAGSLFGALTKAGAGTLTITGNSNSYTGATNVNNGALIVNGSISTSSLTNVASGATLGGNGTLGGATTVNGNLAPGDGVGQLTFTGGLSFGSLAADSLKFQLGANTTAGITYDTVTTNALDIGSTLDFADFQFTDTGTLAAGTYTLISSGAPISGSIGTASGTIGAFNATLSISGGNTLVLTVDSSNPYTTWAGGAGFYGDANGDGVPNGLAWILGAGGPNDSALAFLPVPGHSTGDLTMTFTQVNPMAPAKLFVEYSNDLGVLDPWHSVQVPTSSDTVSDVTFTITGTSPQNVTLLVPASKAAGGKLFGRLRSAEN